MNGAFDVFCRALDVDIAVPDELLESPQRILLLVLRLNLDRRAVVERHRTPAKRLHILHREVEKFLVGQSVRELLDGKIARLVVHNRQSRRDWLMRKVNAALSDPLFQNCEWFIHDLPEPVRNRHAPIAAECPRRDLHAGSGLSALIFVGIHHTYDAANQLFVETHIYHF